MALKVGDGDRLREEFIVCGAAGYPDPFHCDTLEAAKALAFQGRFNHVTQTHVVVSIKRRLVSEFEIVWQGRPGLDKGEAG